MARFYEARRIAATMLIGSFAVAAAAGNEATRPVVSTTQGRARGVVEGDVEAFRGLPYGAPPTGARRWAPTEPAARWDEIRDASSFGARCMQAVGRGFKKPSPLPMSEDCLTLNVMRPVKGSGKLPVMVWIHGGGMVTGTGAEPSFNGPAIPENGVVLVTINYRLGRLGFFAHPAISRTARKPVVANFAILDQIAALKWVRANIAAFGGDPSNVTIFGESAGATSVDTLMASPLARGLFQKAIASSANARMPAVGLAEAERRDAAMIEDLGIRNPDAKALRAIPAEELMKLPRIDAMGGEAPVVDGVVLKETIVSAFAGRREVKVPYLVGSNDYELPRPYQTPDLAGRVRPTPDDAAALAAAYGSRKEFEDRVYTDAIFSEPARTLGNDHARRAPTWRYRFAILSASAPAAFPGASHASDVGYVFQTLGEMPWPTAERDRGLAQDVTSYWVSFARTGDPNGEGRVKWPSALGDRILTFTNDGPVAGVDPWARRLDILSTSQRTANPVFVLGAVPPSRPVPGTSAELSPPEGVKGPPSIKPTIRDHLADPRAKAVLDDELPSLSSHPTRAQFKNKSLEDLALLAPRMLTPNRLAKVSADLAKLSP
ncbi:carboxylesterase/lipase family protein [Sphingomonas sp. ERG5]|uniref:carboxylesterase/lipase family protein n=1 Tax=Sphingomonas sp. ERG5 TaxID=1381597 RepID=UPI00068DB558|nr:carboxylesterase family protein [Sphingomonas sp. ERG5]